MQLTADMTAEDIASDRDRREILLWNFTVLGEAVAQVSEEARSLAPDIGWSDPVRLRNRIVHGYWSVDATILLATAQDDLPGLIQVRREVDAALAARESP